MNKLYKEKNTVCFLCSKHFEVTEDDNSRKIKILLTPCNHLFHRVCLRNWFKNETNKKFCPHCKRSMEWRDATPLGKETKTSNHSSRTNAQSKPAVRVLSLQAEIRHRKAHELLKKKQEAERAKFELSEEQRAKARDKRRKRCESRNAVQAEQKSENCGKSLFLLVLIGSVACATIMLFPDKTVKTVHQRNGEGFPVRQVPVFVLHAAVRKRFEEVGKLWQRRLDAIDRQIIHLRQEFAHSSHHKTFQDECKTETCELEKDKITAQLMVRWFNTELTELTLNLRGEEMTELIELANKAIDSESDLEEFARKNGEVFGQAGQDTTFTIKITYTQN